MTPKQKYNIEYRQRPEVKKRNALREKKWRDENPEEAKIRNKRSADKHREKRRAYNRKYQKENPDVKALNDKLYYERHILECRNRMKVYGKDYRRNLSDSYLKHLYIAIHGIENIDRFNDVKDIMKINLQIKREIKTQLEQ